MGFKDILSKMGEKAKDRKKMIRKMDEQLRLQKLVEDRMKPANERELERFKEEDRQEQIKSALDIARKQRQRDIAFGHNPLNVKNITAHTDWEVLKEKNMFRKTKSSLFEGDGSVLRNNSNLLKNHRSFMR